MKQQNITQDSTERWTEARFITSSGQIEVYSDYLISDKGRVASVKGKAMRIMKLIPRGKLGHLGLNLYKNGKLYARTTHRIMMSSFHPELYFKGAEVDHINRIPTDNRLENLRWTDHNSNNANKVWNPVKCVRVTWLNDSHVEEFDNMHDVSRKFGKSSKWCVMISRKYNGFNKKYNIKIEKIEK